MEIRKFKKEDARQILAMTEDCWNGYAFAQVLEERFGIRPKRWYEYKAAEIEEFINAHPDWIFVAEEDGRTIGYATYIIFREREIGEVGNNAVHPDYRGRGIGSKLHRAVLDELKREGMKGVFVITTRKHIPARKMYESAGFEESWHQIFYVREL
jgi:ribosomal protein S18 acetylase RimI-like enzyme